VSKKVGLLAHGVEVLRQGHLTPLVLTPPKLSSSRVGWEGIALEAHSTPPCDHPYHEHPTEFRATRVAALVPTLLLSFSVGCSRQSPDCPCHHFC